MSRSRFGHDQQGLQQHPSGTYSYQAQQVYRPRSTDELRRLIETAISSLHALGTRPSFNDIADAAGLVSLDALPGSVTIDKDALTGGSASRHAIRRPGTVPGGGGMFRGGPPVVGALPAARRFSLVHAYDPRGIFRNPLSLPCHPGLTTH